MKKQRCASFQWVLILEHCPGDHFLDVEGDKIYCLPLSCGETTVIGFFGLGVGMRKQRRAPFWPSWSPFLCLNQNDSISLSLPQNGENSKQNSEFGCHIHLTALWVTLRKFVSQSVAVELLGMNGTWPCLETHCPLIRDSPLPNLHRDVLQMGQDGDEHCWGWGMWKIVWSYKPARALGKLVCMASWWWLRTQGYYVMKGGLFDILLECHSLSYSHVYPIYNIRH